jgi:predicted transglutaminase-like cysteine proteinase
MVIKYSKMMVLNLLKFSFISAPFCSLVSHAEHADKFNFLMAEANHHINMKYDSVTTQRFTDWETLMFHSVDKTELEKIKAVNDFFNQLEWVSDKQLWHQKDYWATPIETLIRNAGDCEDFSIAKYFTLLALDIPFERLRISYVKINNQQKHMVLRYYPKLEAIPLILDNVNKQILAQSERSDIVVLFSFNSEYLWLGYHKKMAINNDNALFHWQSLMRRIKQEQG